MQAIHGLKFFYSNQLSIFDSATFLIREFGVKLNRNLLVWCLYPFYFWPFRMHNRRRSTLATKLRATASNGVRRRYNVRAVCSTMCRPDAHLCSPAVRWSPVDGFAAWIWIWITFVESNSMNSKKSHYSGGLSVIIVLGDATRFRREAQSTHREALKPQRSFGAYPVPVGQPIATTVITDSSLLKLITWICYLTFGLLHPKLRLLIRFFYIKFKCFAFEFCSSKHSPLGHDGSAIRWAEMGRERES